MKLLYPICPVSIMIFVVLIALQKVCAKPDKKIKNHRRNKTDADDTMSLRP